MSPDRTTGRRRAPRRRRRRSPSRRAAPAVLLLLVVPLAVAGWLGGRSAEVAAPTDPADGAGARGAAAPQAGGAAPGPTAAATIGPEIGTADPRYALVQQLLDGRAEAVRTGDLRAFTAGLARGDAVDRGFRAQQRRWFRNLQQLPVGRLSYEVGDQQWDPAELPRRRRTSAGVFFPVVTTTLRLRRFDDGPVERVAGVTVVPTPEGYRVAAVDDVVEAADPAIGDAPWDLVELDVRRQDEVGRTLLLLDEQSAPSGDTLLALLAQGTARVQAAVPFAWDGDVVAYATGADDVIAAIDDVPGGDVAQVGALAFPIYEAAGRVDVAGFRFALNPAVLGSDAIFLRRLVTHELSHVAVGTRDDGAPTWVSEGVAEYVGAIGLPPPQLRIAVSVVERAREVRRGLAAGEDVDLSLPSTRDFNGPDADWNYGLSWYAAEWIVAEQGPDTLWRLVRAMARGNGTRDADQDAVLRRVLGVDGDELVTRAVDRILATYGP